MKLLWSQEEGHYMFIIYICVYKIYYMFRLYVFHRVNKENICMQVCLIHLTYIVKCSNIYTGTFFKYFLCWNVLSLTRNFIYESRRIAAEIHLTEMLIFWRIWRVTQSLPQSSSLEAIEKKGNDFKGACPYLERARACSNSLYTLLLWGKKAINVMPELFAIWICNNVSTIRKVKKVKIRLTNTWNHYRLHLLAA